MRSEWVVAPESLLHRAVMHGMISIDESENPDVINSAVTVCEELRDSWSDGEGFGSSDFTFLLRRFLDHIGVATHFVNGRLERVSHA